MSRGKVQEPCQVCYEEDYLVAALNDCEHKFCESCIKEHLTSNITNGKAISIKCMEHGCNSRFGLEAVGPFVTED